MGKIDVMVVAKLYGSFQCEENELDKELTEMKEAFKETDDLDTVGDVEVELVSVADVHPKTGDLTQRAEIPVYCNERKINQNTS